MALTAPLVQVQQLPDGSQLQTTINPNGSVYYDKSVGGVVTASSAFDINGTNLFYNELQNGVPTQIVVNGIPTGALPLDSTFASTVSNLQNNVTANPALANAPPIDPALNTINTTAPDVLGGLPSIAGTDASVLNALTATDPTNVALANPTLFQGGLRQTTTALTSPSGALGPGHVNTGSKFGLRHFTFILRDGINNNVYVVDLNVNPEDMSVENPFRVNAYNTLGGAFVDVWGQGIRRVIIRGHTGWRTVRGANGQQQDGFDNVFALRDDICNLYFAIRDAASLSKSQSEIQDSLTLTLIDKLHETAYRVVPEHFKLLRNRTRPLLHMYEASFVIVDDDFTNDSTLSELSKEDKTKQLWNGFGSLNTRFGNIGQQVKGIGGPFGKALNDLTSLGGGISKTFHTLLTAKNDFSNGVAAISNTALAVTQSVNKALGTIQSFADFSGIAADVKYMYADVKSSFNELACLIEQVKHAGLFTYTGIVGSTGCSVALFGTPTSPLANVTNTFETLKQAGDEFQLQQAADTFSVKAQTVANKINSIDTPLILRGA